MGSERKREKTETESEKQSKKGRNKGGTSETKSNFPKSKIEKRFFGGVHGKKRKGAAEATTLVPRSSLTSFVHVSGAQQARQRHQRHEVVLVATGVDRVARWRRRRRRQVRRRRRRRRRIGVLLRAHLGRMRAAAGCGWHPCGRRASWPRHQRLGGVRWQRPMARRWLYGIGWQFERIRRSRRSVLRRADCDWFLRRWRSRTAREW